MVDVSGGWIKLYRSVRHNWLWQNGNERYAKWWMDILMMVNHEPRKVFVNGRLMTIGVGQRLTSLKKLGEMWGVDWRTVSKFLDLLAEDNMIELAKSKTEGTTLKVLNYADYQTFSEEKRKRSVPQDVPGYVPDNVVPPVPDNVDKQEPKNSKEPKKEIDRLIDDNLPTFVSSKKSIDAWRTAWGEPNGLAMQDIQKGCRQFGDELVEFVIKYAGGRGVGRWNALSYLNKSLDGYSKQGIKNVEQAKAAAKEHETSTKTTATKSNAKKSNRYHEDRAHGWSENPEGDVPF
jgi:DNA replication protein DnaD